jgi:hypothetical protein
VNTRLMPVGPALFGFCFCLIFVACESTGVGTGVSPTGNMTATFTWEEAEPTSGKMAATVVLPDGTQQRYQGKYYQITRDSRMETITDLWQPWGPHWGGWPYWGPEPSESFITHYTGQVVANLGGPNGERMRCHFRLLRSDEGMKGGAQGMCQLPLGNTIRAEIPPS